MSTKEDTIEKDVTLHLHLAEDEVETMAHAVLNLRGDHFEAVGKARRNPSDPPLPVIGEELAIARALQDLTGQVMRAAQDKIADFLVKQ
jgi:Domain of unknown function (DUF1876)